MSSRRNKPIFSVIVLLVLISLLAGSVFSASVGRIKGTITDKKTGESLFGVSVQIEGTKMGGKSDFDGNYIILSVSPGTYNLLFTSMGYEKIRMTGVEVNTDVTSERNIQMKSTILETDKVVEVVGTRKGIDFNQTMDISIKSQAEILAAPVANVDELLSMETGITRDADGQLHIRGGRAGETTYLVDGVNFSDPLGGRAPVDAGVNISSSAVLELKVIKDGFDPEYGEALSGVVTITSPKGSPDKTSSRINYYTDDFGSADLNKFSENYDLLEFSLSGPDPFFTSRILPALGINYFEDKDFTFYISSRAQKTDSRTPYWRYNTPATQKEFTGFNLLGINVPDRQENSYNLGMTLAFNPTANMEVKALYKGSWSNWTNFTWEHRFSPATAPISDYTTSTFSLQLKQILSKSSDYEINLSYWGSRFSMKPGDPNHPGQGLNPDDFLFADEYETYDDVNDNYQYDSYEPFLNIFPDSVQWGSIWIPERNATDVVVSTDNQVGGPWNPMFDINNNGIIDAYEGEPFADMNRNGIWDKGDKLTRDINGNRTYDDFYRDVTTPTWTSREEPYIDGDSSLGENFVDINRNGVYDPGIDRFITALDPAVNMDINRDNEYTGPNPLLWEPGIPFIDYNGNGVFDAPNNHYDPGEPYIDINKNGKHDLGGDNNTAFLNYGFLQSGESNRWLHESVDKLTAKGNFKKAIGNAHEIKAGFEFRNEKVAVEDIQGLQRRNDESIGDGYPFEGRGRIRDFYSRTPNILIFYFRDKIEYGSLVASLGMRADLFFQADLKGSQTIQDRTGHNIQDIRNKFSPRVSINYPISERAMIRFNYGHFYELPSYTRMFRTSNPYETGSLSLVGNPNLDYTKTINYTFGVNYAFTDEYSVKMSGFYKDYFDMIATTAFKVNGITQFSYYDNTDYARVRGFEMELTREAARFINGTLSYEYSFAYGKSSSDAANYDDEVAGGDISIDENPLGWDIRHRVSLWLQLYFTDRDHPKLFGISIPNNWDMSVFWRFQTGFPFTPANNFPYMELDVGEKPQTNSMRLPSTAQTDIKMHKRFRISGMQYSVQLWINNLFNNENVVSVHSSTGRPDTNNNPGNDIINGGTEFQANPRSWGRARQIILGFGVQF
ncbi:MAG: TonB-dependent receptor [candidate division Zixibacteria bacterium]|nr:TonB-dependent receptor [candidate division Zixibacteria bacterium]